MIDATIEQCWKSQKSQFSGHSFIIVMCSASWHVFSFLDLSWPFVRYMWQLR